jgi:chorismate mutase
MKGLKELRRRIDEVDGEIIFFLGERTKICKEIGNIKKDQGLPIKDEIREADVLKRVRKQAVNMDLDPERVIAVYREIVNMCSDVQINEK